MKNSNYMFFEQILDNIYNGEFNEIMKSWTNGTDLAIINYLFQKKASIQETAEYFGIEKKEIKERIQNILYIYDQINEEKTHESFSKRSR